MKSLLIIACSICVLMVSCKKEKPNLGNNGATDTITANHKFIVNFNVFANSQFIGSSNVTKDSSLSNAGITKFYLIVYDANGKEVTRLFNDILNGPPSQTSYSVFPGTKDTIPIGGQPIPAFNVIGTSLVKGTYTVVILAADLTATSRDFTIDNYAEGLFGYSYLPYNSAYFEFQYHLDGPIPAATDMFIYNNKLTVENHDINQNITLNRITGELVLNIEDAIPPQTSYIQFSESGESNGLVLKNLQPFDTVVPDFLGPTSVISADQIGKTNVQLTTFILNTVTPVTFQLTCYDSRGQPFATKAIDNVQFSENTKTTLTGKLFDGLQTSNFQVSSIKKIITR